MHRFVILAIAAAAALAVGLVCVIVAGRKRDREQEEIIRRHAIDRIVGADSLGSQAKALKNRNPYG